MNEKHPCEEYTMLIYPKQAKYTMLISEKKDKYTSCENLIHEHFCRGWAYVQSDVFHEFITPDGRWRDFYSMEGKWLKREQVYKAA